MNTVHVAAAIICNDISNIQKVFATCRGYGDYQGEWEFPGGKLEDGESSEEALRREIKEELNTEIRIGEKLSTIDFDYPSFHLTMDCFLCEVIEGKLELLEALDGKWMYRENLKTVSWLPADRLVIEVLMEKMKDS